ncbi:MAG: tRNA (adenosine(37)-N6)-dimethylallyltransferase MiaA, partial [Patescibacteria group bacterium]|nr:tRNA (adenosine(37)-N6)-dimethylallyltransferase MiaA [Patescibacteria group bacterium]
NDLNIPPIAADLKLRKKIEKDIKKYGLTYLYKKLIKLDPGAKDFIDPKNPRRIIRALEVCLKTGQPFSETRNNKKSSFDILQIGLKLPRQKLYQRINDRVEQMIKNGLINEVKKLNNKYSPLLPSMTGIGYRQINLYLNNKLTLEQAVELIKTETRHYAKRQLSWFKRDKTVKWLNYESTEKAKKLIKKFLKN